MGLEEIQSSILDNQFTLYTLNNMMNNYDLQLAIMEKRVTDKYNPLTVNESCDTLNLRFEILTEKQNEDCENENNSGG
jgi:hypothetical protein